MRLKKIARPVRPRGIKAPVAVGRGTPRRGIFRRLAAAQLAAATNRTRTVRAGRLNHPARPRASPSRDRTPRPRPVASTGVIPSPLSDWDGVARRIKTDP